MTLRSPNNSNLKMDRSQRRVCGLLVIVALCFLPLFAFAQPKEELTERETAKPPGAAGPAKKSSAEPAIFEDYEKLWRAGDYAKALETVEQQIAAVQAASPPRRWIADRGRIKFDLGRVDEAIADLQLVERQFNDPASELELALMYRYRGNMERYRQSLAKAWEQARNPRWGNSRYGENVAAMAHAAEIMGENPKTILGTLYKNLQESRPSYVPGFTGAGDLAFRRGDYAYAAEFYKKGLEVEEDNLEALSGLADCYWKSSDVRLGETLERILTINPHHPRAKAIEAELKLDVGKGKEALEITQAMLAINPVNLRFLGLDAAGRFLEDDLDGMKAVQKRALKFNPVCSEVYRTPGRIASRHYRFREGADMQAQALALDPKDSEARALYAFDLLRLGEEEKGKEQLKLASDADAFNVSVNNMMKLMDSLSAFETIERGPFVLLIPKKEAPILADDALALLTEELDRYQKKYDIKLETPILVQIFDQHDDFMVRSVGLPGSIGYMGICFGRLVTMDSPSARSKWTMNWRSVLWHEFAHVVTLQKTKNRMPRWLSEGISVYEETQRSKAWGQRLSVDYKAILEADPKPPGVSDLEAYFTRAKSPAHLMFGYFLAGEFVNFYASQYGDAALVKALALIGDKKETLAALAEGAGVSLERLDQEFGVYLKKRLAPLDNLPAMKMPDQRSFAIMDGATTATLTRQPWAKSSSRFTDAMERADKAIEAEKWDEAEAALKQAHEFFPDYMGADAPLRRLISVYEKQGRHAEVRETLRREIEWNQSDFPASQKLVALLEKDGDWAGVVREADWALGIDPFDVSMRRSLLEGYRRTGDTSKALMTLAQLALIDPARKTDYSLARVEILTEQKRWPEARRETVALLEETPHFWKAQSLLLEIVEKETPGEGAREGIH